MNVLLGIKKICNIDPEDTAFDQELILHTNAVLMELKQIGVTDTTKSITDDKDTWDEILGSRKDLEAVKSFIGLKVRQIFDPPTTGAVAEALSNSIRELEWRLNVEVDPGEVK